MFLLPFFERISQKHLDDEVNRQDVLISIKQELQYVLKYQAGQLPENYSRTDLNKWILLITQKILDHESRLLNLDVKVINIQAKKIKLEISGQLLFDNKPASFIIEL